MSQNASLSHRNANLDLLRLVAALAVVGFHFLFRGAAAEPYLAEGYPEAAPVAIYGYLGVNLFFLISGFVIAASAEGRTWQAFALARFARIYPGFLVCMSITAIVLAFAGSALMPVTPRQFVANLLIFSPALGESFVDGVYWSIVLELVFYGWVALAIAAGIFSRFKLELVAGWLIVCAVNETLVGNGAARMLFLTEYGPLFAAGILMQHISAHGRSRETLLLLTAAFALSCQTMFLARDWMLSHYGVAIQPAALIAADAAIFGLLAAAVALPNLMRSGAAAAMIGGVTYPLYLLHQHIGYLAIDWLAPLTGKWLALPVVVAAALVLSYAVWRLVEQPARPLLIGVLTPVFDWLAGRLSALAHRDGDRIGKPAG